MTSPRKLSYELWGIEWEKHVPVSVGGADHLTIEIGDVGECLEFGNRNYQEIFDVSSEDQRFARAGSSAERRRYYERVGDFLAFRDAGRLVGFFVGNPIDWDSYYLRHACVLPESRGHRWMEASVALALRVLARHGVSIVETHVSSSNFVTHQSANRLGFFPAGSVCTTRWGALVHYVGFLNPDAEATFRRQFCYGMQPESRVRQHLEEKGEEQA